ncbi:hemerythrin domain-containing protein [Prescottella subtropica]|uniref:hemerythrin domain-containing protein n=1 Tax=Prescottella subtropica TaxID=2545757 RepID=UPI0010F574F7|nr:hemerythrin domain-containing protein [Prescottella subtropica]
MSSDTRVATPLSAALTREHHDIDAGIAAFVEGRDVAALTRAADALRRHIYLEEEFLFPPLRAAGLMGPVLVMLREHGLIWRALDRVQDAVELGGDPLPALDELAGLLDRHNTKEEPILYPGADTVLDAAAARQLTGFLASGRMPDGWVCAHAGE